MERIVSKAVGETKRINRKVVAVILAVALISSLFGGISLFANTKAKETRTQTNVNLADHFDADNYLKTHYTTGRTKDVLNHRIGENSELYNYVDDLGHNPIYIAAHATWVSGKVLTNPLSLIDEVVKPETYYGSLLLDLLSNYHSSESVFEEIVKSDLKTSLSVSKKLASAVELNYQVDADNYLQLRNSIASLDEDMKNRVLRVSKEYVEEHTSQVCGPLLNAEDYDHFELLLDTCNNLIEYAHKVANICTLSDVDDELVSVLSAISENTTNKTLKKATDEMIEICKQNKSSFVKYCLREGLIEGTKPALEDIIKDLWKKRIATNLGSMAFNVSGTEISMAFLAIELTRGFGNLLFSTDSKTDSYIKAKCIVDVEKEIRALLGGWINDSNSLSGQRINAGVKAYYSVLDCEYVAYLNMIQMCRDDLVSFASDEEYDNAENNIKNSRKKISEEYLSLQPFAGLESDTTNWIILDDGSLLIYGCDEMSDYSEDHLPPWNEYKEQINRIYVSSAVTKIGNNAFKDFDFPEYSLMIGDTLFQETTEIYSGSGLYMLSSLVNSGRHFEDCTIVLKNDIDLSNIVWIPIGETQEKPFSGSIEGNNHVIKGFKASNSPSARGLVGYLNSKGSSITDLVVEGNWSSAVGSPSGVIGVATVNDTSFVIRNIINRITAENISSIATGGIVGQLNVKESDAYFYSCTNDATVESYSAYGGNKSGGIIGEVSADSNSRITINNCLNKGEVRARSAFQSAFNYCGGLIGYAKDGDYSFSQCAVGGLVYAKAGGYVVGGLIGYIEPHYFEIEDCLVSSQIKADGIGAGSPFTAGMIADMHYKKLDTDNTCQIKNSYVSSAISGGYNAMFVNSFDGYGNERDIPPISVQNTYFDQGKTSIAENMLVVRQEYWGGQKLAPSELWIDSGLKSSEELKTNKNLYEKWDMDTVWSYSTSGYPILLSAGEVVPCSLHNYSSVITEPTCTAQGYTTHICENCGYTYKSNIVPANGHGFSYTKTVAPTCTAQGYDLYTCAVCGVTEKRNTKSATGHAVLSYDRVVPPTCVAQGYSEGSCSKCGQTIKENYVEPVGHDYAVTHTQNASCTETGIDTYTCKNCGDSYTKDIVALGHSFAWADNIHIAPSCTEEGYTVETCSRCGETQRTNTLPATGHDFGDIISYDHVSNIYDENKRFVDSLAYTPNTVTANTIGSTAIGSSELLRAGWAVAPREIRLDSDKLGAIEEYAVTLTRHPLSLTGVANVSSVFAYDDTTQRSPEESALPYTDSEGNLYSIDSGVLSLAMNREQAEQKGILNPDGTVNVLAAEAENLKLAYSAGIPGTYILLPNIEFQNALTGWNEPVSIFHYDGKGAAEPGVRHVNYCFYNETLSGTLETTIKLYDYSKQNQLVPSTSDMPSYIKHTCVDCGSVVKEDIQSDQKLKIKAVSLSLGNNLSMNFKVDKTILDDYSDLCIEIMRNGKVTKVSSYKVQGDDIVFSFDGIAPQTMNDNTSAVLYGATPSKLYRGESVSTSVKEYASKALELYNDNKYAKLRTLMVDLLNYGSTAQIYHNYQKASLANADLTEEQQAWASIQPLELENITNTEYQTVSNPIANWKSASLILDNAVAIRYKFECEDVSGMVVKVQYGDIEKVFDGTSFEESGTGEYSFKFSGLYAHQMRLPIYVTLYKDDKPVSNTLQYSVESYAAQVAEIMPESSLNTLTDSMMRYGISAFEYGN